MSILTSPEPVLADNRRSTAERWLGSRRAVAVSAVTLAAAGLWFGWPALVAAGVAPIILAVAPCLLMCGVMCAANACSRPNKRNSASAASTSLEAHVAPAASGASSSLGSGYACCAPTENPARRSSRQPLPQPGE